MLSNSMDALEAFSHISENLPSWLIRLSDLRDHTASKHKEYVDAFKIHGTVRPRPQKNSSICSIRTDDSAKLDPGNPSTKGTTELIRDGTIHDERMSLFSSRHNIIIHYDGHTQKVLEEIVRNITTARNHLRRGKMSQLPLSGFRSSGMLGRKTRVANPSSALLNTTTEGLNDLHGAYGKAPREEPPFDSADKLLEVAHSLCESAAHKFLRSGDCAMELNGVEENFNSLLGLATAEVERFGGPRKKEQPPVDDEMEPEIPTAESSKPDADADDGEQTQAPSGAIEVDDVSSSVSGESIDMTAFRVNRLRRF